MMPTVDLKNESYQRGRRYRCCTIDPQLVASHENKEYTSNPFEELRSFVFDVENLMIKFNHLGNVVQPY